MSDPARLKPGTHKVRVNSLAPGRPKWDFENVSFNLTLLIGMFKSSYEYVPR